MFTKLSAFNEWLAVWGTRCFGTMWTWWLFFLSGFVPLWFPGIRDWLLYYSNTIQLWSLPLIMVGGNLLRRSFDLMVEKIEHLVEKIDQIVEKILTVVQTNHEAQMREAKLVKGMFVVMIHQNKRILKELEKREDGE